MSDERSTLTLHQVRESVARALRIPADELDPDGDLFEQGLDSLALMSLAGEWRGRGHGIGFAELVEEPVLSRWVALLAAAERTERSVAAVPAPAERPATSLSSRPRDDDETFPLATMQHAYWIGRQDGQPLGGVAPHFYTELDGEGVDPERLRRALRALVDRHAMLRASFDDGRQRISPAGADVPSARLVLHDLRDAGEGAVAAELDRRRQEYTHARRDVTAGDMLQVALTLLPAGGTRLHIDLDMMAGDALSLRVLLRDLCHLYHDPAAPLPELGLEFPEYVAAHAESQAAERSRAGRWWAERLPDLPPPPLLPLTVDPLHPVAASDTALTRSRRLHHWLDPEAKDALITGARSHGLTPAAVLATAFAEAVAAWSGSRRFLLNLPVFDREPITPDVAGMIGDFSSSLLLDADLRQDLPFTEQARRIQDGIRQGIAHAAHSGVDVLRELARQQGAPVIAPVVYTSAIGLGEIFEQEVQGAFGKPVHIISQGPQVALDAQVTELDGGLLLNWDVREGIFEDGVPEAAFTAYLDVVDGLVTASAGPKAGSKDPWRAPVAPLPAEADLEARSRSPQPDSAPPAYALHDRFFALAEEHPQRTAVVTEDGSTLCYAQLALAARRVAGALGALGVRRGDTVAVTLPKGAAQITAVLGVLAAGAAYVPVGVDQPAARRELIHRLSNAAVAVTDDEHAPLVERAGGVAVLRLSEAARAEPAPVSGARPEDPAYLLFTSGSTGEPKGVEVPHQAAVNTLDALAYLFDTGPDDAVLALSALDFDLSVFDVFAPLSVGGRVVAVGEAERRDPARWADAVREHGVTIVNCVPALLDLLLAAATAPGQLDSLRLALLGGDWVGMDQPAQLHAAAPGCRFVALGGMTEAAIHSTVFEVTGGHVDPAWRSIPWGVPLRNVRTRVVDERGHDRPTLVPGELWIGGRSLATGYRGDPERTAARFVTDRGERWYRSGDRARYRPDGTLEFLGRTDHQVKIRGHRVELGEIEAVLQTCPGVQQAVAVVIHGTGGDRLGAAVSPDSPTAEELTAWAADRLPPYLRPDAVLVLPSLPLTANAKLDRAAVRGLLEAHDLRDGREVAGEQPVGAFEEAVAELWAELLGRPGVVREDSFFALGGDSLVATRVVSRLRAQGFAGAAVADLFAAPVLHDFAARLNRPSSPAPIVPEVACDPALAHRPFPLTEVQTAYVTGRDSGFTLGGVGTWHYSEFDGEDADLERLERAWQALVRRHDMLRAVIEDGTQRVLPEAEVAPFHIPVRDVTGTPHEAGQDAVAELRGAMSHEIRDPARWPLFDLRAVRYRDRSGAVRTRLGVGLDYVVLDALSIVTLYTEWGTLYADPSAVLPALDLTYRDYQSALAARAAADPAAAEATRAHWRSRLEALPPAPRLPYRTEPAAVERPRFARRRTALDAASWQAVKAGAVRHGLTPSAVLLAAYGETLAAWSGTDAVAITLTLFNRHEIHPHVHRVVGDFTSLSLAGYHRTPGPWLPALRGLQRRLAEDLDHQDVPATWLLRELARRTGTVDPAAPVVFTSALGVGDAALADPGKGFPERVWGVTQTPQVSLDHQVTEENGALVVTWDAVEELFSPGVLDEMAAAHARLLHHLARGDWDAPVPDLLPPGQRARRAELNATPPTAPRPLHEAFFARAAAEPDRAALIAADGRTLSYGETAQAALRTARALRSSGVAEGDPVAVTLPKGPEQVIAVLGVLAAGAVYVPIGVEQPATRRECVRRAAGIRVAIAEDEQAAGSVRVLTPREAMACDAAEAPLPTAPDALAYIIFTSGSTGEPKGVPISHAAAWNTVAGINARHGIGGHDRVMALSALDFDLSVYDIFGLLAAGGALVLPTEEQRREPRSWRALLREHGVTVWNTVPALLDLLLSADERAGDRALTGLRTALLSGDWIGLDLPGRLMERAGGGCHFIAMGGATEASIWSNTHEVEGGAVDPGWPSVPYGHPLTGQRYRVCDPQGRDCPDWVPGELWIGGAGLAEGYLGDAERTAAKFVTRGGERWYRTGDLGRYRPGGTIEFLGRTDQQMKIAGHRIEAGEVEAALAAHPGVARAAVVAVGPREARRLAAFTVPTGSAPDGGPPAAWLRPWLAERLAPYALPTSVETLAELPLTANGKVDRHALIALAEGSAGTDGTTATDAEPPRKGIEAELAELWQAVLPGPVHGRDANFFTLGGDSLTAIRVVAAVERRLGARIPVRALLAAPTLAALAAEVTAALAAPGHDTETGEL
ncbi:non-ribosomal peptide synthetase [Streptomyces sp. TS71-3]|uniref:non-ribosomal peptide synthetase n=1 Tax=Streptomyces sp. TS71-3 TaxID=2733862 RepID=UPI001B132E31|nr:non-ribosomal peptide synthetase [Streptomyces sp. TS71-3]GHJ35185.1 non-ribosomal peptide synthetase [Streptomyces sp. TS71-3]